MTQLLQYPVILSQYAGIWEFFSVDVRIRSHVDLNYAITIKIQEELHYGYYLNLPTRAICTSDGVLTVQFDSQNLLNSCHEAS